MAVYRNLQEQVFENAKDIEELQTNKVDSDEVISMVTPLIEQKLREKHSIYFDDIDGTKASVHTTATGSVTLETRNSYNSEKVEKTRGLIYLGEYFEYHHEEKPDETFSTLKLPKKSGTLALVEDIPVNNGILKIGNTEITEEQLQQLLQLIQNQ